MSKIDKLYAQLLQNPGLRISYRDFGALFAAFGFEARPGKGSHTNWKHPQVAELLTSQPDGKEAAPYQVKRLLAVIEAYDLHVVRD